MHQDERHALLAWAMESKCTTAVILLLRTGKIYFRPDSVNRVVLLLGWAYRDGHQELFELLLYSNAVDLDCTCDERSTLLYSSAEVGDLEIVKLLTATGRVNCNSRNGQYQQTPLSVAIEKGFSDVAEHLLGTGQCQVDVRDTSGWTPLSMAVQRGRVSVVRILLDEFIDKIDLHSRDMWGESPIVWAQKRKCKIIHRMLVEADEKKIASERRFGGLNARAENIL
ncbi:ankyrin [Pyrenochaeta sp. DS3sAY3a]|nr:ankyrin [Pyrenochaeta sp. DS3sAY3a]